MGNFRWDTLYIDKEDERQAFNFSYANLISTPYYNFASKMLDDMKYLYEI